MIILIKAIATILTIIRQVVSYRSTGIKIFNFFFRLFFWLTFFYKGYV